MKEHSHSGEDFQTVFCNFPSAEVRHVYIGSVHSKLIEAGTFRDASAHIS